MKIYIVTEGEYSDYHIEEVFSTYEQAEKYVALQNDTHEIWREYYIEEYDVDDCKIESKEPIYYHYIYSIKMKDIVDKQPTFKCDESYVEYNRFHYWSKNGELTNKCLSDAYMKWQAEIVERYGL